jgi:hypothetical protein
MKGRKIACCLSKAWLAAIVGLVCVGPFAESVAAELVTFDAAIAVNPPGFQTQGYKFNVATNHYHLESANVRYGMSTPTTSLVVDDFNGPNSLVVTTNTLNPFDLHSLDIASRSSGYGSTTVTIRGDRSGGGILNHVYVDSNNSTFENLVLNWANLTSVRLTGSGNSGTGENWFRIDNLRLTEVPEPSALLLLSFCLSGILLAGPRDGSARPPVAPLA